MDCVYIEAAPNNSFQPTRASEPHARCVVSLMLFLFVARAAEFGRWAASQFFLTRQREYVAATLRVFEVASLIQRIETKLRG